MAGSHKPRNFLRAVDWLILNHPRVSPALHSMGCVVDPHPIVKVRQQILMSLNSICLFKMSFNVSPALRSQEKVFPLSYLCDSLHEWAPMDLYSILPAWMASWKGWVGSSWLSSQFTSEAVPTIFCPSTLYTQWASNLSSLRSCTTCSVPDTICPLGESDRF